MLHACDQTFDVTEKLKVQKKKFKSKRSHNGEQVKRNSVLQEYSLEAALHLAGASWDPLL